MKQNGLSPEVYKLLMSGPNEITIDRTELAFMEPFGSISHFDVWGKNESLVFRYTVVKVTPSQVTLKLMRSEYTETL